MAMGSCGTSGGMAGRRHAAMLGIGTANPTGVLVPQDVFAENLFRVTNSDHLPELKEKLRRICEKSGIERRHFHLTEETLAAHPELFDRELPSLDTRVDMTADAVPKLAQCAAAKAIAEWGRPTADITHLVFSTYSACQAPTADLRLATLLGLRPTVSRTMLSLHGCYGGGRALSLAKELAENNRGARVLVACSEMTLVCFGAPDGGNIVGHALFGDGAGAVVVGAGPFLDGERRPIFEMVSATQTTIPRTEHALGMRVSGGGVDFHLAIQVPTLVGQNVEQCLLDAFRSAIVDDDDGGAAPPPSPCSGNGNGRWNDLFWAVHPGGRPILDNINKVLMLEPEKLAASRHVLREYGNMSGATIVFVLDELRRGRSPLPEWGALLAFGPGITIEAMVLRCPR
ncbi:bisdemethoxycurcumin synthase-like [Triticum dicoccoides]|uniref:bisdemethoxycurcumin synthase-like n=1 Tax=Triticum dicoccoides TaxID=85692 RepID=UPI001890649F|nr:bisdemethoxycurcumin synthase-like [Triticum dicoccoides]